ncbi:MAG: acetylxylan esterase, partial [Propionibacteriaceae bacterium]|nr:acetylxylan esterase [Propionibacteriaceae bacterium]
MPRFDLSPSELRAYRSEAVEPADFDAFWAQTLADHSPTGATASLTRLDTQLRLVDVWDVTFAGYDGHPVKAWLRLPAGASGPLPGVVEYVGYGGGRGLPHEHLVWPVCGYAHLLMDTRGQGSAWSLGETPDPTGSGPSFPGFMTRGIESPDTYYYRRVYVDAVRAIETLRTVPSIDPDRIGVTGVSQGGGISIAAAGLVPGLRA